MQLSLAQTANAFETISIKDGLSHNEIWDFEQDKYGYMWIATADGLNKYDGYSFTIYKNDPNDSTSIPANLVSNVLEDKNGDLWISTGNGIALFDRSTEQFKSYQFANSSRENANFVASLFEDSRGILWVACTDGIKSFDRETKTFKSYEVLRRDNTIAAQSAPAYTLVESPEGELYVSTIAFGLMRFDYENNLFAMLKLKDDFQKKLQFSVVFSTLYDSEGKIWYGSRNGLFKVDPEQLTGEEIINPVLGRKFASTSALYETKNREIWIGTFTDGLFRYSMDTGKFDRLPNQNRGLYGFYTDKTGLLWMGSFQGILKYNFDKAPYELYTLETSDNDSKPMIISFSLSESDPDKLWLGSNRGLYQFDRVKKTFTGNSSAVDRINRIGELSIEDITETKNGKLYLGTTRSGLIEYDLRSSGIKKHLPVQYSRTTIRFGDVNILLNDSRERLWLGQVNGVSFLNDDNKTFTGVSNFEHRQYSLNLLSFLHNLRESRSALSQIIEVGDYAELSKEFVVADDSYVLISGIGEGNRQWGMVDFGSLESADGETLWTMKELETTFQASGAIKNRHQIGIMKLQKGRYKLSFITDDSHSVDSYNQVAPQDSLYWGIELYSLSEEDYSKYQSILTEDEKKTFMLGTNVMSLFESSDNKIWAATLGGLSEIDPETMLIKNYTPKDVNSLSLSNLSIQDVCEDNFGNIWVATEDGLNKINREKNEIFVFRERDGLPSSNLRALLLDDDGNLWVSSIKGISKVEISDSSKTPIFINYDVRDGLQGYSFIGNAAIKDSDGKLYFSGPDGFNAFKPGNTDKSLPKIVFTNLSVSNKSADNLYKDLLETRDLNELTELNLAYNQNDISFEFSSVHFARPDKNRLQYKMDGVDEEWHEGSRRIATYTNLDPGDYVFKVRGSNGDGFWVEEPKTIKVSITPAWWNNTYAYIGYGLIFFGFLYAFRKFEMERRSRVSEYKQSKLRAEAAELKAKAAEAERKLLEAENERKSKELEEARSLQLSMLPRELPQLPNLDIAVYMKTATEVGGDYYDFHVGMDGVLTVVLGDATGHGMKAGTMVTTTKSLFNVLAPNPNIVETFHEMTRCLKLMHLEKLSMCMSMLKIASSKVQMSSAGMPPIFIYKKDERVIEEHVIKGMPLGTMQDFPYVLKESEINTGDSILIMSDGFPELLNDKNKALGYKRVRNLFEENSAKSPEDIISVLRQTGDEWTNYREPDDDITFVVIKVK